MSRVKGEKSENFCEISFLYAFCDSGAVPGAFSPNFIRSGLNNFYHLAIFVPKLF